MKNKFLFQAAVLSCLIVACGKPVTGSGAGSSLLALPDSSLTPGKLCSPSDPDFQEYRYDSHMPYCSRSVTESEKSQVAQDYGGIPKSDWSQYEFDHFIPLSIGGTDEKENIWPQPIDEAHEKDKCEDKAYLALKDGKVTQDQAVQAMYDWRPGSACEI